MNFECVDIGLDYVSRRGDTRALRDIRFSVDAVLLGDRILVMTGQPGRIREQIVVPLARPRDLIDRDRPEILKIKEHVWALLEDEVRSALEVRS